MTYPRSIAISLVLTAFLSSAAHGQAMYVGTTGGTGEVRVYSPDGSFEVPPGLDAVHFLPVEISGRTAFEELDPTAPRLRSDIPFASRLELPQHAGSVYHFERANGSNSTFGWLHITDGDARTLLEQPGTGPLGSDNPFLPEVAYAPDALLVASLPAAGGKLFEIDLSAGTSTQRTATGPPIDVAPNGLQLSENWGVVAGVGGFWRFDRIPGATASLATGPITPVALFGGIASSDSGVVAASAGIDNLGNQRVFVVRSSGPIQACAVANSPVLGAGLPGAPSGPFLALSDDGTLCAWATDEGLSREVWTEQVAPLGGQLPAQVTQDDNFVDTLDETGFLSFTGANELLVVVGEADAAGIDSADLYSVLNPVSAVPDITNLSGTSHQTGTPFGGDSELSSDDGLFLTPDRSAILAIARQSGSGRLLWIPLDGTQPIELLPDGKEILLIEALDSSVVAAVLRSGAGPDRVSLLSIPLGNPAQFAELANVPDFVIFDRTALLEGNAIGLVAAVGSAQFLARVDSGGVKLVSSSAASFGPTVAGRQDTLTATFAPLPTLAFPFHWSPTALAAAAPTPMEGFVLP